MNYRSTVFGMALIVPILLTGCANKPHHKQVREEARDRMALVQAQMAYDQGKQAFETGQFETAMKQVNAAIARANDQPAYYILKGRIQLEQHDLEGAIRSLEQASTVDPALAEPHYYSGIVFQRWSNFERAAQSYQRAMDLEGDNVQYLLATAESLISLGRYAEARQLVVPKLAYFEHNAALRQLLGEIALLEGDPVTAARLFDEARLMNPDDLSLLEQLARSQFAAQKYAKAYESVKKLQQAVKEERPELLHLEARCLVMLDRISDARNVYQTLTKASPTDPMVWIEYGNVALEVGDTRRVASCAQQAINLAPSRFEGYLLKGLYERSEGQAVAAVSAFRDAASRAGNNPWPHVVLGMMLEETGRTTEARAAYKTALKLNPNHEGAQTRLSRLEKALVNQPQIQRPE